MNNSEQNSVHTTASTTVEPCLPQYVHASLQVKLPNLLHSAMHLSNRIRSRQMVPSAAMKEINKFPVILNNNVHNIQMNQFP